MDHFISVGFYYPMNKYLNVNRIWIIMVVLTISTYAVGKLGYSGIYVVLFLLTTAIIKSSFIISDFMEVRGTSLLWRILMYGWLWLVTLTIAVTYLISQ